MDCKRILLILLMPLVAVVAMAQHNITGMVIDDAQDPIPQTTVRLLKTDSTLVKGALTNMEGKFKIATQQTGEMILQVTCVGFKPYTKRVKVAEKDVALGTIAMEPDAIMLKGATVTGQAAKVTLKADTFIYNAAAFRTPEGSVVEELVRRLPGAEVSDDGSIKINGKQVKKILVDGKEFMTGDTKTAMKNLPTNIIDRIKAYDKQSDMARVSGIEDGEEETVLDFGIKAGMNKGVMVNADLAAGTKNRYAGRVFGGVMKDDMKVFLMTNANNTNDQGFPGGGGGGRFGGGRQGLNAMKMTGLNLNYEKTDKLKIDGSIRWNHSDGDTYSKSASESFYSGTTSSFSNSRSQNFSRSNQWNGQMRLEWQPDSMTNIMFRPNFSYSSNDATNWSTSATFDQNPYDYSDNPLSEVLKLAQNYGIVKNYNLSDGVNYSDSKSLRGMLQYNRRLNSRGRNITLQLNANWGKGTSESMSNNYIYLFTDPDTTITNRYNLTPQDNWGYSLRANYSEPIADRVYLQFGYRYQYSYTKSDRKTYSLYGVDYSGIEPQYRSFGVYLNSLPLPLDDYEDQTLSRFSNYKNYTHTAELTLRVVRPKYNLNVGISAQPQRSHFIQQYLGRPVDTVRNVTNMSPTVNLRYRFNQQTNLQVNFRGQTQQPSITQLLEIYDDTNPLNISMGNAGLKPSFSTNLGVNFQKMRTPKLIEDSLGFMIPKNQRNWSFSTNANLQRTSNSIGNVVTYNETTGGRLSRPENINGNWGINGGGSFNIGIDTLNRWDFSGGINGSYRHHVGYVNLNRTATPDRNVTHTYNLSPDVSLSFRNRKVNFSLNFRATYAHTENELQASRNITTWNYNYGGNCGITFPWETRLNTDFHCYSKRGYADETLNTDELIWNAQLSHSFLKGKKLTVMLQWYDILHEQTNFSRTVNANGWRDTEVNTITSYAMLHVSYRLNFFGGRGGGGEGQRRGFDGGDGPRGGRGGGFGGGRGGGRP